MQPFSRETIIDRRQPAVRWSAVFAGAAIAAGTWLTLQLVFTGGALIALDPEDVDAARVFGIGTTAGTMLAAVIAMFLGGLVAARIAAHYDRKVALMHGLLVWAVTGVAGIVLLASAVGSLVSTHERVAADAPSPGARSVIEDALRPVNAQLKERDRPQLSVDDIIDAAQHSMTTGGLDRVSFASSLDDQTDLDRGEVDGALRQLGTHTDDVIAAGHDLAQHRQHALAAAEDAGSGMLAAGVSLLLCLGAALGGALVAQRLMIRPPGGSRRDAERDTNRYRRATTEPGHTTAPYPPVSPSGTYRTAGPVEESYIPPASPPPASPYPPGVPAPPIRRDDDDV